MQIASKKEYDFEFNNDKSDKFIPFILGFLMYSVTIALMSAFFTQTLTSGWDNMIKGKITIEFQPNPNGIAVLTDKQKDEVITIVRDFPGIKNIKKLDEQNILEVIKPWLKDTPIPDDFPLPILFDVEARQNTQINLLDLSKKLERISPNVQVYEHSDFYKPVLQISRSLFAFAILLSVLIFLTVCVTIVFITKKTLNVHEDIVKILQLIGANNRYIASQFKKYYLIVGIKGGFISLFLSLLTLVGFYYICNFSSTDFHFVYYVLIALCVALVSVLIIMITANRTVLYFLNKDDWCH